MPEKKLMKGNEAAAEAAVRAGCRYYFGYPITPQSEVAEYLARRMFEAGGFFLQAESEVAAVNMALGAGACGARVMTSSSGPGLSLKQECISHMAGCRLPCLILNVSRAGPGVGTIHGAQGDYFQSTRGGGHGDYHCLVYAPNSVQEMADYARLGLEKADEYRMPVILLSDGSIGQMMEPVLLPEPVGELPEKDWALRGFSGQGERRVFKSLFLAAEDCSAHNLLLQEQYRRIEESETRWEEVETADAKLVLVAFGVCARIALSALRLAREEGLAAGLFRPVTVWPFPYEPLRALARRGARFLVVEQNAGQMLQDLRLAAGEARVEFYGSLGGLLPGVDEILSRLRALAGV